VLHISCFVALSKIVTLLPNGAHGDYFIFFSSYLTTQSPKSVMLLNAEIEIG